MNGQPNQPTEFSWQNRAVTPATTAATPGSHPANSRLAGRRSPGWIVDERAQSKRGPPQQQAGPAVNKQARHHGRVNHPPEAPPARVGSESVRYATGSVRDRAIAGDKEALETLFGQFIPNDEEVVDSRYLGVLGVWGFGTHSFAAITPNRVAALRNVNAGRGLTRTARSNTSTAPRSFSRPGPGITSTRRSASCHTRWCSS